MKAKRGSKLWIARQHGGKVGPGAWCACPVCEEVARRYHELDIRDGEAGVSHIEHEANVYCLECKLNEERA